METNSVQSLEAQPKTQLHEEIAELEKNLEEKKRLAGISGVEIPYEKEVFKDVIKEHISQKREQILSSLPPSQAQAQQAQVADDAQKLKENYQLFSREAYWLRILGDGVQILLWSARVRLKIK